jgi:hypothetical protein
LPANKREMTLKIGSESKTGNARFRQVRSDFQNPCLSFSRFFAGKNYLIKIASIRGSIPLRVRVVYSS